MRNKFWFFSLLIYSLGFGQIQLKTPFEKGNGNQSATYRQTIDYYQKLQNEFSTIHMQVMGTTDSGEPLHVVTFSPTKQFNFKELQKTKSIILVNNGIHAGEPDGVDATMMLFRDLAIAKISIPKNVILVTIPVYNIGGMLNRNSTSRVNQNGPEEYGFRGNGRNFDLNRDMIKADTKNARSLIAILHTINPDIFIDNHVSNGADYQYELTYIQTEPSKLGKSLGNFVTREMTPAIVKDLEDKKIPTTPYVNVWGDTPDKGFAQFSDTPRYTTGYTSLCDMIGYVVETHMWKDYAKRVKSTYDFMVSAIHFAENHTSEIKKVKEANHKEFLEAKTYPVQWVIDSSSIVKKTFLGYQAGYKKSEVTTGNRLFYDREKPYSKEIPFYSSYKATREVVIPKAYMIPKSWWNIIDLLKMNDCQYTVLKHDTLIEVERYKIEDYKTGTSAYEGHYVHRNTKISKEIIKVAFKKGDYMFPTQQKGIKILLETLEPEAIDSYFNWNFFDTILQQKEGYSDYLFEDLAAQLLKENPDWKQELAQKVATDSIFAKDADAQLDWVYKKSKYYEKAHLQYPVYRILK